MNVWMALVGPNLARINTNTSETTYVQSAGSNNLSFASDRNHKRLDQHLAGPGHRYDPKLRPDRVHLRRGRAALRVAASNAGHPCSRAATISARKVAVMTLRSEADCALGASGAAIASIIAAEDIGAHIMADDGFCRSVHAIVTQGRPWLERSSTRVDGSPIL